MREISEYSVTEGGEGIRLLITMAGEITIPRWVLRSALEDCEINSSYVPEIESEMGSRYPGFTPSKELVSDMASEVYDNEQALMDDIDYTWALGKAFEDYADKIDAEEDDYEED